MLGDTGLLGSRGGFLPRVLTPAATRGEAGSRSSLRSSDEPGSRLYLGETTALSQVHRDGEAIAGDPLHFASPQALARNQKTNPAQQKNSRLRPAPANPSPHTRGYRARGDMYKLNRRSLCKACSIRQSKNHVASDLQNFGLLSGKKIGTST